MSRDYQFISVVDNLQVVAIEDVEGAEPRTLAVTGTGGFTAAQRVTINDYGVDTFELVTDKLLLVPLPDFLAQLSLADLDVVVVSSALTGTRKARILFGPTRRTKTVNGLQKLVQQVLKETLSRVNSNRFRPADGGDIPAALGTTLNPAGKSKLAAAIAQGVERVKAQFLSAQVNDRTLAASERLLEYRLEGLDFETNRAVATLRLQTYAGLSIDIPLEL